MIPKRIRHKGICDHAQTPYQRRKCRATKIAATIEEKPMEKPRYEVTSMNTRKGTLHYIIDTQNGGTEVYRTKDKNLADGRADRLNNPTTETPAPAKTAPTTNPMRPGWSKAARRLRGESDEHPLGRVIHRGAGFTEYEDEAFGGGRVQIWDRS